MQEIEEPTLLQTVRGHKSEVTCADASGGRLVTGGGDRALRLWRWERGAGWDEVARCGAAHRYGVTAARWAASGVLLASGGVDGVARVWSGRDLAPRRLLAAPGAAAARALCWAGRARLLVGHDDGVLCVWHAARGVQLARLHAHEGALHAVAAPARGALLLSACTHGVLKVFDLAGELLVFNIRKGLPIANNSNSLGIVSIQEHLNPNGFPRKIGPVHFSLLPGKISAARI
ncbi:hypothetical protein SFRURICE_012932 [Spodoptera frugiperda]|nr:hypothetical protein SFRURICE_012932 [Spodoptera frugiperda]